MRGPLPNHAAGMGWNKRGGERAKGRNERGNDRGEWTEGMGSGPALGMFEVFGRTGPQILGGGRNFGP